MEGYWKMGSSFAFIDFLIYKMKYIQASSTHHLIINQIWFYISVNFPIRRLKSVGTSTKKEACSIAVVEGLVSFACVPVPFPSQNKTTQSASVNARSSAHYYACTVTTPQLLLERLNKDIAVVADGPVNLLETLGIEIQFRKVLTRKYLHESSHHFAVYSGALYLDGTLSLHADQKS